MVSTSVAWDRIVDDLSSKSRPHQSLIIFKDVLNPDLPGPYPAPQCMIYILYILYNYTYRYLPAHLSLSVSPGLCLLSQWSFESKFLASPIMIIIIITKFNQITWLTSHYYCSHYLKEFTACEPGNFFVHETPMVSDPENAGSLPYFFGGI